jgi:hypothetical protein
MPSVQVADGHLNGPNDEKIPVKIIEAASIDGVHTSLVIPLDQARGIADALTATAIEIAQPGDVPPPPKEAA